MGAVGREIVGATEYEEPPVALLAEVLVHAPEYEEPPVALLASKARSLCRKPQQCDKWHLAVLTGARPSPHEELSSTAILGSAPFDGADPRIAGTRGFSSPLRGASKAPLRYEPSAAV